MAAGGTAATRMASEGQRKAGGFGRPEKGRGLRKARGGQGAEGRIEATKAGL